LDLSDGRLATLEERLPALRGAVVLADGEQDILIEAEDLVFGLPRPDLGLDARNCSR